MSAGHAPSAAIRGEPDGYDMAKPHLMGRQSAGNGFLRAAVHARADRPIYGFTPSQASAQRFSAIVREIDESAAFEWIHADQMDRLADIGVLYIADATVSTFARARQRAGLTGFSICGVTHTTASHGVMNEVTGLMREAVTPWDALVCTSTSVLETVRRIHEAEADYQSWRFGVRSARATCQLPLIPLGVHCDDFAYSENDRKAARAALDIQDEDVVGLFVGRLVFHAKAHPFPLLRAMQGAAERTGKRLTLLFSGWAPNAGVENAYRSGAAEFAPDVRTIFVDGRNPAARAQAWAGADMFLSPSDNIQETFGLTPIEAMAAGLPVIVSDYDGYRDTVRHMVDGIRVPTWAPRAGMGQALARAYESGAFSYDRYSWAAAAATAVDIPALTLAVCELVENAPLRRAMGEAGRKRAKDVFDWGVVYRQYQALWGDLNERRVAARSDPALSHWIDSAPRAAPAHLDPFHVFGHYPTRSLTPATRLAAAPAVGAADVVKALSHPLFGGLSLNPSDVERLFAALLRQDLSLHAAAKALELGLPAVARLAALLLKMGLIIATEDERP